MTERVELGTLVLCSSFRGPSLVAKMAVTADAVSEGRVILGLGAGWHDPEYRAFGYPTDHRVDRFEEFLRVAIPLLRGERVTFSGRYHAVEDAVLVPAPTRRIPVLVAGDGPRMLRLTARFADAWNTAWFGSPDDALREQLSRMDEALATEGRDPATLSKTVGMTVRSPDAVDDGEPAFGGSVPELAAYADLGIGHVIVGLQPLTERSLDRLGEAMALRSPSGRSPLGHSVQDRPAGERQALQ